MPNAMKAQEDENLNKLKIIIEENTKNYSPETGIKTSEVTAK
ncbi:MAG: hypothetical protein ACI8P3_002370 [Saprospiraceae bacterium]|jgi:hypothetical protein